MKLVICIEWDHQAAQFRAFAYFGRRLFESWAPERDRAVEILLAKVELSRRAPERELIEVELDPDG